jgi:signal transduction histidine kinase
VEKSLPDPGPAAGPASSCDSLSTLSQTGNTILLVDDEPDIREVLEIYLSELGYTVHAAENGEAALKAFRRTAPAIVLSDIKMPGMDGIELLRRIKAEAPTTEVIMITGHGDMALAIDSLKLEATDFITKPINDDMLAVALRRAEERIAMRQQLRAYTENLEHIAEEKTRQLLEVENLAAVGRAASELAHTIKNIAGALKGGIYVMQRGIEDDNRRYLMRGWGMVEGNVDKIKNLAMDLLDFGKAGNLCLRPDTPLRAADEALTLLRDRAAEKGIAIKETLPDTLDPIQLDSESLYRCMVNLIQNAIEAFDEESARADGREIHVEVRPAADGGVVYAVSDNGPGMDADTQKHIFKGFFSTKGTRGTGIGLMMTKRIIERHGGRIEVASGRGSGTVFTLHLPPTPPDRPVREAS